MATFRSISQMIPSFFNQARYRIEVEQDLDRRGCNIVGTCIHCQQSVGHPLPADLLQYGTDDQISAAVGDACGELTHALEHECRCWDRMRQNIRVIETQPITTRNLRPGLFEDGDFEESSSLSSDRSSSVPRRSTPSNIPEPKTEIFPPLPDERMIR